MYPKTVRREKWGILAIGDKKNVNMRKIGMSDWTLTVLGQSDIYIFDDNICKWYSLWDEWLSLLN